MEYKYEFIQPNQGLPVKILIHTDCNGALIPGHWHESIEISYVLSGKIDTIYIDGEEYTSKEGDIVLINSNAIHSFSVNPRENQKALTIFIPYEFMKVIYPYCESIRFHCVSIGRETEAAFQELRCTLDAIVQAFTEQQEPFLASIKITSLCYELMYILLKYFRVEKQNYGAIRTSKHLERLAAITDFIKENYQQELQVEQIARTFNLSSEYLSKFFMKHVGVTVLHYLHTIRLERSYRDLMNTDKSVLQIALEHGFPNVKSYNRVFKTVYGTTPHQYRKQQNMK